MEIVEFFEAKMFPESGISRFRNIVCALKIRISVNIPYGKIETSIIFIISVL